MFVLCVETVLRKAFRRPVSPPSPPSRLVLLDYKLQQNWDLDKELSRWSTCEHNTHVTLWWHLPLGRGLVATSPWRFGARKIDFSGEKIREGGKQNEQEEEEDEKKSVGSGVVYASAENRL